MSTAELLLEYMRVQAILVQREVALGNQASLAAADKAAREIGEAIAELLRQGDTLVRAEDLQIALRHLGHAIEEGYEGPAAEAHRRLKAALGGVL